jgi:tetratricopeptide (TPR) repeat protein
VFFVVCISCGKKQPLVEKDFVAQTFQNFQKDFDTSAKKINEEMIFWKERINGKSADLINSVKYAGTLISQFHLTGNVNLIKQSDSILFEVSNNYNHQEAGIFLSLCNHYILQHRFNEADSLFKIADNLGLKNYSKLSTAFDVQFELGLYQLAEKSIVQLNQLNDFGYQFRISKLMHYKGDLDSSIAAMKVATQLTSNNEALLQNAQSNLADLYLHNNDVKNAYKNFKACLQNNASDLHSLMGIGWLALIHDNNDSLAKSIFEFATTKTALPDPLFKLVAVAQHSNDSSLELQYAKSFEQEATREVYGKMYSKYLIQLYTQVLNQPRLAVELAKKEITNRATPQTYSWLVFALANNQQFDEATKIYNEFVEGKPLEGLELYWMGKYMLAINKIYNAKQYFKEAIKNKYDLLPRIVQDIELQIK